MAFDSKKEKEYYLVVLAGSIWDYCRQSAKLVYYLFCLVMYYPVQFVLWLYETVMTFNDVFFAEEDTVIRSVDSSSIVLASSDGACLFNATALSFAYALSNMSKEQFDMYISLLSDDSSSVCADIVHYFNESNSQYKEFSLSEWKIWFSEKNIRDRSDRQLIESEWAPVLRRACIDEIKKDLRKIYSDKFRAVSESQQDILSTEDRVFDLTSPIILEKNTFSTLFDGFSISSSMSPDEWQTVCSSIISAPPVDQASINDVVAGVDSRYMTAIDLLLHSAADATVDEAVGIECNSQHELFGEHYTTILSECNKCFNRYKGDWAELNKESKSEQIYKYVLPLIMTEFLKKGGWLECFFDRMLLPETWASVEDLYPLANKWHFKILTYTDRGIPIVYPAESTTDQTFVTIGLYYDTRHNNHYNAYKFPDDDEVNSVDDVVSLGH